MKQIYIGCVVVVIYSAKIYPMSEEGNYGFSYVMSVCILLAAA